MVTTEALVLIVMAAVTGLALGAFAMYLVMDRRVQREREARDHAVDLQAIAFSGRAVSNVGVREQRDEEAKSEEQRLRMKKDLEEWLAESVGTEDPNMDDRMGAGVEL